VEQDDLFEINSLAYPVSVGSRIWPSLHEFTRSFLSSGRLFILTDHFTHKHCLPLVISNIPSLSACPTFSVRPGEQSKDAGNLELVWEWLLSEGAGQDSLLVNLGGGVVSDLGGFAAATYKRGIDYINVPTSLIGQADAAVGGKTGINVAGVKNQAGVFHDPQAVFILPPFLDSLPDEHYLSGFAEILKSAMLSGDFSPKEYETTDIRDADFIARMIKNAVKYKCDIVARDPFDRSDRRVLNFGHTIGHAIESLFNHPGMPGILHGEAVVAGMLCELHISAELKGLPEEDFKAADQVIRKYFKLKPVQEKHFDDLFRLIDHDKKKTGNLLNFTLLQRIGEPLVNCIVNKSVVLRSLKLYNQNCQQ